MPYELLILVYCVAAAWLTLRTHQFKSPVLRWALITLLPISLLAYAKLRVDIFTLFLFAPLFIATGWSFVSIILLGIKLFISTPRSWRHFATHVTRPLICICVFATVRFLHTHSLQQARIQATETAIAIQQTCNKDLRCPTSPPNSSAIHWKPINNHWETRLGSGYANTYHTECSLDAQTYSIVFRINIDEEFEITGGVHRPFEVYGGPYLDEAKHPFNHAEKLLQYVSELNQ